MTTTTHHDTLTMQPGTALQGSTTVPGDKSLSHRSVLLGAIAQGASQVRGWLAAGDTEATLRSVGQLGVQIERHDENTLTIHGGALQAPSAPLDFVNAGTGIRLAAGIMAGQPFASTLDGSAQLRRRPMKRIIQPLLMMGANINGVDGRAPLHIQPSKLNGMRYNMPVASAQVKSAVLLAGLSAKGATMVVQPGPARDHTERMLMAMGADIEVNGNTVILAPNGPLQPLDITVPGDFSSAAFLIAAALIVPDSAVTITNVNLNRTRTGFLDVVQAMGGDISVSETGSEAGEPVGEIRVRHSQLKGIEIGGETVVRMIDEFPVLMVLALHAEGDTVARDANELRLKETDRIAVMAGELRKLGAVIEERSDGFKISGPQARILTGALADGHDDHRVAMSLCVAGLMTQGATTVTDAKCIGDSFPGFAETLTALGAQLLDANPTT